MYKRKLNFEDAGDESLFLLGARQAGKSTLLKSLFPDSVYFDLLLSDVFERLQRNPAMLREMIIYKAYRQPVKLSIIPIQQPTIEQTLKMIKTGDFSFEHPQRGKSK